MTDRITGVDPISPIPATAHREGLFAFNRIRRAKRFPVVAAAPTELVAAIVTAAAGPIQRAALNNAIGRRALNIERFSLCTFAAGATLTLIDKVMGWQTYGTVSHVSGVFWLACGGVYLWLRRRNRKAARAALNAADGVRWETIDRWEPGERTAVLNLLQDHDSVDIMSSEDGVTTALVDAVQNLINERDALRAERISLISRIGVGNYITGIPGPTE